MSGPILSLDPRFNQYVDKDAELRHLAGGCEWTEGPVWIPAQRALIWSDIPNDRMMRWTEDEGPSLFRHPSNYSNGNTLDGEGRIVTCEHTSNRISRTEHDGTVVSLVETYQGKRLDSPNDLVVKSDGSIWFTDPPYGILSEREGSIRDSEIGANHVYRLIPDTGELTVLASDFDRPNGIAFSPDERTVYISDTGTPRHMRAFDVTGGDTLSNSRVFAELDSGVPDGFRVDTNGNMWTSAADGVHLFLPDGTLLGKILVPEKVSNCEFGGPERSTLFITASTSLYAVDVLATGARRISDGLKPGPS